MHKYPQEKNFLQNVFLFDKHVVRDSLNGISCLTGNDLTKRDEDERSRTKDLLQIRKGKFNLTSLSFFLIHSLISV